MVENTEMRIFGQISDLHQARMVREEREWLKKPNRGKRERSGTKKKGRKPELIMIHEDDSNDSVRTQKQIKSMFLDIRNKAQIFLNFCKNEA